MAKGSWAVLVLGAVACAPESLRGAREEAASAAAGALARARACAERLERMEAADVAGVERALAIAPVRLAAVRGTPAELEAVQAETEARLEVARANAAAARALAAIEGGDTVRRAEDRAVRAIRAADELCQAAAAVPGERLARRREEAR